MKRILLVLTTVVSLHGLSDSEKNLIEKCNKMESCSYTYEGRNKIKFTKCPQCELSKANLEFIDAPDVNLEKAYLSQALFRGATLTKANFKDARLQSADFLKAKLQGAQFNGAVLTKASFKSASLEGATFTNASLDGTNFTQADLNKAHFEPTFDYIKTMPVGITFSYATLTNANLKNITFGNSTSFNNAILTGTDLSGADLSNVTNLEDANDLNKAHCDSQTKFSKNGAVDFFCKNGFIITKSVD